MTEILEIPAGVIMPKDLLMWLRKRRDEAREEQSEQHCLDDPERFALLEERIQTYSEVMLHIQYG